MSSKLGLLLAAVAVFVSPVQAASVTWDFGGVFHSTNFGPHGTSLAGSMTFDTNTPNDGLYNIGSLSFTVSGYQGGGAVTYTGSNVFLSVVDSAAGDGYDLFQFTFIPTVTSSTYGGNLGPIIWQTGSLTLSDPTGSALQTTALPSAPPSLSGFGYRTLALVYDRGYYNDYYTITSLETAAPAVPEPASLGLVTLGVAGVGLLRSLRRVR